MQLKPITLNPLAGVLALWEVFDHSIYILINDDHAVVHLQCFGPSNPPVTFPHFLRVVS